MVVPGAADPALNGSSTTPTSQGPVASRLRTWLLVALVAVLLVAAGAALWFERAGSQVADERSDREQAMAQASQFLLRMGTYGPDLLEGTEMPEYRDRVREVITPKFAVSFEEQAGAAEQLVAQAGATRAADIYATGVSSLEGNRAVVLVAGQFTESWAAGPVAGQDEGSGKDSGKSTDKSSDKDAGKGTGQDAESGEPERVDGEPIPFRLRVNLVKVDGTWLVDDFNAPGESAEGTTGQTPGDVTGQEGQQ